MPTNSDCRGVAQMEGSPLSSCLLKRWWWKSGSWLPTFPGLMLRHYSSSNRLRHSSSGGQILVQPFPAPWEFEEELLGSVFAIKHQR